jgi:hypothetical protein
MPRKISQQTIWFMGFYAYKHNFPYAFDGNLSVTHVFIKQIFIAAPQVSPSPSPPPVLGRGWGSSGSFQPQAVALVMDFKP